MPIFRQRFQKRCDEGRAAGRRDRVDLPVGALLLALFANRNVAFIGQPVERRVDRAEARLDEVLISVVLEQLLDFVPGGVAAGQNPQANGANVHALSHRLYWTDIDRRYICLEMQTSSYQNA